MNIGITKEITGKIEQITDIKPTKKDNRFYSGIKIRTSDNGDWFNLFGNELSLKQKMSSLEVGSDVKIVFSEKDFNGKTWKEIKSIYPIRQETLQSPANDSIPIALEFTILENGRLSLRKLKDALELWRSDMEWTLEELNKIEPIEEEGYSD